jgi:putative endonuclease
MIYDLRFTICWSRFTRHASRFPWATNVQKNSKMDSRQDLGREGERLAAQYLEGLGMTILERNWRFGHKEIDLIAREGNDLVIVEVKTRTAPVRESPDQAIPREKRRSLVSAANAYVRFNRIPLDVRFDTVNVVFNRESVELTHVRDAFFATL